MRTYIPPYYANSLMSRITSLLVCKQSEMISQARARNPSKAAEKLNSLWKLLYWCSLVWQVTKSKQSTIMMNNEAACRTILNQLRNLSPTYSIDLSASVKTTDLWSEHVWRSFSKLQVSLLEHINNIFIFCVYLKLIYLNFLCFLQSLQKMQKWPHSMETRHVILFLFDS